MGKIITLRQFVRVPLRASVIHDLARGDKEKIGSKFIGNTKG